MTATTIGVGERLRAFVGQLRTAAVDADNPEHVRFGQVALVFVPLAAIMALAWFQSLVPVVELLREPKGDPSTPAYTGLFTTIGFLLWGSAAAVALLTMAVLRRADQDRPLRGLLMGGALLSVSFLADDALLIHEAFAPDRGIPEQLVVALHGVFLLTWVVWCRRRIVETDFRVLALAAALFVTTMGIDLFPDAWMPIGYEFEYFIEESTKLFAIVAWFLYFAFIAYTTLTPRMPEQPEDVDHVIDLTAAPTAFAERTARAERADAPMLLD